MGWRFLNTFVICLSRSLCLIVSVVQSVARLLIFLVLSIDLSGDLLLARDVSALFYKVHDLHSFIIILCHDDINEQGVYKGEFPNVNILA